MKIRALQTRNEFAIFIEYGDVDDDEVGADADDVVLILISRRFFLFRRS